MTKSGLIHTIVYFFLIHMLVYTHGPVTYERSLSVFMLGQLQERPLAKKEIQRHFEEYYFRRGRALEKRLSEQQEIANIEFKDGKYQLTPKGERTLLAMKILAKFFAP